MSWAPIRDTATTSAIKKSKGFAKVGAQSVRNEKVYSTELTQFCVSAQAMALPWGCPLPKLFGERYTLDLVLASDVVYHEDVVGTLFSTLLDL